MSSTQGTTGPRRHMRSNIKGCSAFDHWLDHPAAIKIIINNINIYIYIYVYLSRCDIHINITITIASTTITTIVCICISQVINSVWQDLLVHTHPPHLPHTHCSPAANHLLHRCPAPLRTLFFPCYLPSFGIIFAYHYFCFSSHLLPPPQKKKHETQWCRFLFDDLKSQL